jgi:hypothetical protein
LASVAAGSFSIHSPPMIATNGIPSFAIDFSSLFAGPGGSFPAVRFGRGKIHAPNAFFFRMLVCSASCQAFFSAVLWPGSAVREVTNAF